MRGAAAALALLAASGVACSSAPPKTRAVASETIVSLDAGVPQVAAGEPAPSLDSKDSKQVARTLKQVSELRGFPATRPVPGVKLERGALVARIKDKALREYPPEALRREGQLLQIAGFAPPQFDYLGEMMKLLDAQLEGFYEPKTGTMYLAADLEGPQAHATLAHELVHALQDQRWDLKKRSDYKPGEGDRSLALGCLAEGDATSLMFDVLMKPDRTALDIPPESIRELMKAGTDMGDIQSVPHIMRTSLVAPYIEGIAFVNKLRKKRGWAGVDAAWERLPTSTEQILHVDKWEAQEAPLAVPAPTAAALGEGWKNEDQDTFGELGFALEYAEWMSEPDARLAASGWGGDRTSVLTRGDEIAYAVHERYDAAPKPQKPEAYAERAFGKLVPALQKALGKPAIADKTTICFDRKDLGPLLFAKKDRELVMTAGPAKVGKDAWSSAGTCAAVKKWADEIAAQQ
ncbi:MAG: hypothetical protein JWP97_1339 [Labilithrix sp.]|nr:hypothetical protein [Labilithrix sp.]